ncbi:ExeA family protein [Pseudohaliea rubra]|uniref:General secretion pathway protein A n=1 Tax=Pseudohaliea rubra DSM 19751 TaxID=1265313 RepID=A0A095VV33_9GAMM|nr:ExeA family protein [Pseudohaliea rubra]KGE04913.1 General secretion pathway protein A [Pseudohaliea rubra DSM 19751]
MYYQYFGLREAPFSIAVNPRYLFMSHRHRDALAHLLYGVGAGGAFIVLTGEVGTGKTTINRALLEQLPEDADIAIVLNPALDSAELLATVCDELGIAYDRGDATSLKALTDRLHRFLLDNHARGRRTVLLIDEAQHLAVPVLEQIRLLTNLETDSDKLLHIILIGQPELAAMLQRPELRQLNQRVTARYNLEPLSLAETGAYIRHRLQVAGLGPGTELFPPRVVRAIHRHSHGVPRLINLLCDRTLLGAYGQEAPRVDKRMLRKALGEVTGELPPRRGAHVLAYAALALAGLTLVALAWWAMPGGKDQPIAAAPAPGAAAGELRGSEEASPPALPSPPWLLPPEAALRGLYALQGGTPVPDDPCAGTLRCERGRADTWQEFGPLERPLLLELVTPERFAASALLLVLGERSATLATREGVATVPLAVLASYWRGGYRYLWDAPDGFGSGIAEGDQGPAVRAVAERFARLDKQAQPLAAERFTPRLTERVRLFQRTAGLVEDGIVGTQTLRQLNAAAGLVLPPSDRGAAWDELLASGFRP